MSDETPRCEPPPEWRGKDGWHWLHHPGWGEWPARYSAPCHAGIWPIWRCPDSNWTTPSAYREEWRYVAPVTPPQTVAALVEALEGMLQLDTRQEVRNEPPEANDIRATARAALALYGGEP